ncbi:MAG TPA: hypothetical protein VFE37_17860 [Chloroflexota bacterium]|nr:hypothetical protein [Chloroflexota bacterium]
MQLAAGLESLRAEVRAATREQAARESGRLTVLRESLQEGQRPWWRRLKGKGEGVGMKLSCRGWRGRSGASAATSRCAR